MRVTKWLVTTSINGGEPVCEIETDGVREPMAGPYLATEDDPSGLVWKYVEEGMEIGPNGLLLEYSVNVPASSGTIHTTARTKLRRRPSYPRVFLNYRRDDADAYAGRIHESLTRALGESEVFMDTFSLQAGEVFSWTIQQAVAHADALIMLVGPKWMTLTNEDGRPRILAEWDFVRREIVAALDRGIAVLPVLLPGAQIPEVRDEPLRYLPDFQFQTLSGNRHWQADMDDLVNALHLHLDHGKPADPPQPQR